MKKIQEYEIMSPVGSYESLTAAIQGGADSIYFGIEGLNMRAKSSNNFTIDDLHKIVEICKENGLKSYLTVNTIIYDNDITLMRKIVDAAKEAKLSAIIAADVAVMMYARSIGVDADYGSLEAGRWGNVVLADENLNIRKVIRHGEILK